MLCGLLLVGGLVYALRGPIALRVMRVAAPRAMTADRIAELPDGLHLILCGAGSPLPDPQRSGPCAAVVAGERLFLVDAGSAAARNLQRLGLPVARLEAVLLTHFHSDHIDGLGELQLQRWATRNRPEPLPLYGPRGVASVSAGFEEAYRLDKAYRVAHHGPATMPPSGAGFEPRELPVPEPGNPVRVLRDEELTITGFVVDHAPVTPAVGYRFDYGGRSLVVSGDTARSAEVEQISKGVDLLVHEALAPRLVAVLTETAEALGMTARAKITRDILDYHATPVEAAETAAAAGARHLLFYHVVPPLLIPGLDAVFLEGVDDAYGGGVTLGRDGTRISLPSGSDAIDVED